MSKFDPEILKSLDEMVARAEPWLGAEAFVDEAMPRFEQACAQNLEPQKPRIFKVMGFRVRFIEALGL